MSAPLPIPARPLRRAGIGVALIAAVALLSACLAAPQSQVQAEMNADRQAHRLSALPIHPEAQAKAQAWAEKLARENTLYHSRLADGMRSRWCSLGENVGYGGTIASVQDAYMNSPGHRANILASKWNGVGVGYATNGQRVFTVQVFVQSC